jgi:hypothetical protein
MFIQFISSIKLKQVLLNLSIKIDTNDYFYYKWLLVF